MPPHEPKHGDLTVWGEMGGREEGRLGEPFVGRSGQLLRGALKLAGQQPGWPGDPTSPRTVAYRNVVLCCQPGNKFPGPEIGRDCLRRHQRVAINSMGSNRHLVCGANAVETLSGWRPMLTKKRGTFLWLDELNSWGVATVHPAFLVRGAGVGEQGKAQDHLYPLLCADIAKAAKRAVPRVPRIHFASPDRVLEAWSERSQPETVAMDVEGRDGNLSLNGLAWNVGEAWVMPWSHDAASVTAKIIHDVPPVAHNAPYDVGELELTGVPRPKLWFDTINMAALLDPGVPMGLESQVLTHVPGSVEWKGLIDHSHGCNWTGGGVLAARARWRNILTSLGRGVPSTGQQWFAFYNGLDTAWGLELFLHLKQALKGRWKYYVDVMLPLQRRLYIMGKRGLPVDQTALARHQTACRRLIRMAERGLKVGAQHLQQQKMTLEGEIETMEGERYIRRKAGERAYFRAKELTSTRNKLKTIATHVGKGFDYNSPKQKAALLYEHFGLPEVRKRGTKAPTTDQPAIESLLSRLIRGTIRPNKANRIGAEKDAAGVTRYPHVEKTLRSMGAASKWDSWLGTFLKDRPTGRIQTTYSQHRNIVGRLSSGTDDSEFDKKVKRTNLQNIPPSLRDIVPGDFIGVDWAALHWAIVMLQAHDISGSGFHLDLLEKQQAGKFDPHRYLASFAFEVEIDKVTDQQRQWAKAFTFGRMYLGAPRTLGRKNNIPDKISERVCDAHEEAFRLRVWQEWTIEEAKKKSLSKRGAYVESPLGWRRYFWSYGPKETDVLASSVLAIESDMLKRVMNQMPVEDDEMPEAPGQLETSTHDSVLLKVRDNRWDECEMWALDLMEQPIPWLDGMQFRAKAKRGKNWREAS